MSNEKIRKFIEEYKVNPELQKKLKLIKTSDEAAFNKITKEAGFDLSVEEWREYVSQEGEGRNEVLADDELANISGGGLFGLTQCPKKYDEFLCIWSWCPQVRSKRLSKYRKDGDSYATCYFCKLGYWDEADKIKL